MELFKSDEVLKSEDEKNSLTSEKETQKKLEALLFIRDLAIQLGLSQSCVATAQVYFHKVIRAIVRCNKQHWEVRQSPLSRRLPFSSCKSPGAAQAPGKCM
mmetsp:Transcript_1067/g.1074  ORF Transcript_1067/g.1074 Transcript_1067/m.1074 type:complete len:101 (+) Transcript_1067:108-410(+)